MFSSNYVKDVYVDKISQQRNKKLIINMNKQQFFIHIIIIFF